MTTVMRPTKAVLKENALYEAASGKLIKDQFENLRAIDDCVKRHYLVLPVVDNADTRSIASMAAGTRRSTTSRSISRVVRIAAAWASEMTSSQSNLIVSVASRVGMSLIHALKLWNTEGRAASSTRSSLRRTTAVRPAGLHAAHVSAPVLSSFACSSHPSLVRDPGVH